MLPTVIVVLTLYGCYVAYSAILVFIILGIVEDRERRLERFLRSLGRREREREYALTVRAYQKRGRPPVYHKPRNKTYHYSS